MIRRTSYNFLHNEAILMILNSKKIKDKLYHLKLIRYLKNELLIHMNEESSSDEE